MLQMFKERKLEDIDDENFKIIYKIEWSLEFL